LIQWLNKNADRTETLVETPGMEMYKGYSRFAIYTGLPTVLGWEYQVGQQLGVNAGSRLAERASDVRSIYSQPDDAQTQRLLEKYHVRWVVVGSLERKTYEPTGFAKFERLGKPAFRSGDAVLYRIEGKP